MPWLSTTLLLRYLGIVLVVLASTGCVQEAVPTPSAAPSLAPIAFDSDPQTVILYSDIHYPGIPLATRTPADRYCESVPTLRVWGDGYAFLDPHIGNAPAEMQSGHVSRTMLQNILNDLTTEHFFSAWAAPGPNPAGTWIKIGAKLQGQSPIEYQSGDLEPPLYTQIIATITPALTPIAHQKHIDPRVTTIVHANATCNAYMKTP